MAYDDLTEVPVEKLPYRLRSILSGRNYRQKTISAQEMVRQFTAWHLGDASWGTDIIAAYNDTIEIALDDTGNRR